MLPQFPPCCSFSVTWPEESVRTATDRDWTPAPSGSGGFGDWVGNMVERFPSEQADVLPKFVRNRGKLRRAVSRVPE